MNITGYNTSSSSLFIRWSPLSPLEVLPAELKGYCVHVISLNNPAINNITIVYGHNTSAATIERLGKYSNYSVALSGRSNTLCGAPSKKVFLHTDEDGK